MKNTLNDKQKFLSYVLYTDDEVNPNGDITQQKIAKVFGVSQSTIAQTIKEVRYRRRIADLEHELSEAKRALKMDKDDKIKTLALPNNMSDCYRIRP